ncbi:hypothetical protein QJS04_geneDACA009873 [Acorus gramineus]|uniref:SURP motif domain-containing protein n=1 Tax=Acorus gramineus TaxID=55184 RepID=A0AAV9BCY9_ACOGR|nr:hypothetical protein QJS04_geneDACA009873 [Acorus gramineus]
MLHGEEQNHHQRRRSSEPAPPTPSPSKPRAAVDDSQGPMAMEGGVKEHINRTARYVANDGDGSETEAILMRLFQIHGYERWGFLCAGHPYHEYYERRKMLERIRRKGKVHCR